MRRSNRSMSRFPFFALMIVGVAEGELQDEDLAADVALSFDHPVAWMREEPVSAHLIIEFELVMDGNAPTL